jgi:hypothetical protein
MNKLKVIQDSYADSPRDWDNLGTMICFHSRYNLGDEHSYSIDDYSSWDEMEKGIIKEEGRGTVILPLYLYDHSGISMSVGSFGCKWDSGQVGFIMVNKSTILKEFGGKIVTKKLRKKVEGILKGEVETYTDYLEGNVYGFQIVDEEGDSVDSCFGFYGRDFTNNGMLDYINEELLGISREEVVSLLKEVEVEY